MAGNRTEGIRVEVCVSGLSGARIAAAAGADRLELCSALPLGGLTPSPGLLAAVREAVSLPLIVLVRPREGGFLYDTDDRETMLRDIAALRGIGADGFAIGALTPEGALDAPLLEELGDAVDGAERVLHRAFDHVRDPHVALERAIELGFDRILTSGQAPSAPDGAEAIARAVRTAADRLEVMPGGGVNAGNVAALVAATGVRSVHLSASRWREDGAGFRSEISLGAGASPDESRHLAADGDRIRDLIGALARDAGGPGSGRADTVER